VARDALPEADARARLEAQWPIDEKGRRAHYVIRTDGGFAQSDEEIERVHRRLVRRGSG